MTNDDKTASQAAPRRDVISLLLGALPGLLFGAYVTGLLFFINPELDPSPEAVLGGVAFYGALFGVATSLLSLLLGGRSVERARALLPWSLTAALALAAASTWVHAYRFAHYLPPGLNIRLVKAAVLLSIFALLAALTSLLHTIDGRRYGTRSRLLFAVLSIAVLYIMVERRAAFDPPPQVNPLDSRALYRSRPELWVIGVDGATLDAILPLAEQGELPFFSQLLTGGTSARLESFPVLTDTALWTTVATGHHLYRHRVVADRVYPAGVLGRRGLLRLVPYGFPWWGWFGAQAAPTDASHRKHLALWEILSRLDISAGVIGWPASYPAHEPLAYTFSDRYFAGDLREADARPHELAERGVLFQTSPDAISPDQLAPLGEPLPFPLLQALADDLWRESLTEFMIEQRSEVDAIFLRMQGLSAVSSRYYGAFSRVQFEGAQDPPRQEGARLLTAYYRHVDRFLAAMSSRPNPNRLLVVLSAFGYDAPRGWRRLTKIGGDKALEGTRAGAPDGLMLIAGPGIAAGRRLPDSRLVDVLPTALYALRLPIARDLDGRVLTSAFESSFLARQPLSFVPSYETLTLEAASPLGPELLEPVAIDPGRP